MRVTGYVIKDESGANIERSYKEFKGWNEEKILEVIEKVIKSNGRETVDREIINFFLKRLEDLLHYFELWNSREIRGSSILMIVDNVNNLYDLRVIDLASIRDYDDLEQRDEGYIFGIKNLIRIINKL